MHCFSKHLSGGSFAAFASPLAFKRENMKIVEVLKNPVHILLAVVSGIAMLGIYAYTQVLGIIGNLDIWLATIPWFNALTLVLFVALFGVTFSYQVYLWRQPKTCSLNQKISGAGASGAGTFGLFFVAQCPACASLGALFLPVSAVTILTQFSWLINILTIGLLVFTLNYLGAFKK
ncbi:MAG: hypothetical protein QT03_C0001G0138 [archaeon GW2011_AR10]|nr:MAG: hypothetical protein QT03_C0001G0138 [archaeon GW2011_AR10]